VVKPRYGPIVGLKLSLTRQAASLKRPLRPIVGLKLSPPPLEDGADVEACRSMSLEDGADGITWPFAMTASMILDSLARVVIIA
jgi:hypothetical protein